MKVENVNGNEKTDHLNSLLCRQKRRKLTGCSRKLYKVRYQNTNTAAHTRTTCYIGSEIVTEGKGYNHATHVWVGTAHLGFSALCSFW